MAVTVSCPGCAATIGVSEEILGKKVKCKRCQEMFIAKAAKVAAGKVAGDAPAASPARGSDGTKVNGEAPLAAAPKTVAKAGMSSGVKVGIIAGAIVLVLVGAAVAFVVTRSNDTQLASNDSPKPIKIDQ